MSHSLGEEKDQLTQQFEERLNAKISSATGAEKIVLLSFKEGLQQTVLYDIKTYPGFSGAPVLNKRQEARAIHVRGSPDSFDDWNQGISFAAIAEVLESSI